MMESFGAQKIVSFTISEGATDNVSEGGHVTATEGALPQSAPSLQLDASRDLSRMIKRMSTKNKNKPYMLDVTKDTNRTSSKQRKTRRVRKQAKVRTALVALHNLAEDIHKRDKYKLGQSTECFLSHHADVNMLEGDQMNDVHPLVFAASGQGPNPNILNHGEAMAAVDKDKFDESMNEEMVKLYDNGIYEIVKKCEVPELKSILRAVWSHMRKTTPDGKVYRHRSRICADGSTQKHGIDYNETYSPVVMCSTLRTLFVLSKVLGWSSRKVDYVQAFPQAKLDDDEEMFMHIPRGFHVDSTKHRSDYVLKLKKNLYGLKQASYNWSELLNTGLFKLGFKQSKVDPCLYLKDDIICAIYVDDTIFWAPKDSIIDKTISELRALNFDLTDEGDVDSFLGIKIDTADDKTITMSQPALTDTIIKTLGLNHDSKSHKTPAVSPPLQKYADSAPFNEKWIYRSLIGMLTYLARNTRPDIEYAVH